MEAVRRNRSQQKKKKKKDLFYIGGQTEGAIIVSLYSSQQGKQFEEAGHATNHILFIYQIKAYNNC